MIGRMPFPMESNEINKRVKKTGPLSMPQKKWYRKRGVIICIIVFMGLVSWFCIPPHLFHSPTSFVLEDKNGVLLSASIAADGQWRFPPNGEVPEKFIQCI